MKFVFSPAVGLTGLKAPTNELLTSKRFFPWPEYTASLVVRSSLAKWSEADHTAHPIGWSAYDVTARSSAIFCFVILAQHNVVGRLLKKTSDYPFR